MDTPPLIVTNDFHSCVPQGRRMLAAVRAYRARGAWVLDAGDFFGGNAFHEFSEGRVEERLLADLYDALVPGNHDLADLRRLESPDRFPPVVCANLRPPPGFPGRWESGLLLPERGLKVGVVGYLGRQAYEAVPAGERAGFGFVDPTADLIAAEQDRLLCSGADIVIGVSHSGFALDVADQENGWPFSTVLSGHCHSPWYHWASADRHVVKAPETGEGHLRLDLDRHGGHRFIVETVSATSGTTFTDGLGDVLSRYVSWGAEPIGTLPTPLPDRRNVARLLAERAQAATGADAFFFNLWALRGGLPQIVTRQSLMDCAPFDTDLVLLNDEHPMDAVQDQACLLNEELATSLANPASASAYSLATTSYLADRLGLGARPVVPPRTLRGILTDLVTES
ncbi:metallophosphoesterase [Streptomyces sp. NPDC093085]|uniref:metallophosphoesterase n=1 Tax=Streptomyces sp. NPDC093085 TaxID=3155068 RepID=UPI003440D646